MFWWIRTSRRRQADDANQTVNRDCLTQRIRPAVNFDNDGYGFLQTSLQPVDTAYLWASANPRPIRRKLDSLSNQFESISFSLKLSDSKHQQISIRSEKWSGAVYSSKLIAAFNAYKCKTFLICRRRRRCRGKHGNCIDTRDVFASICSATRNEIRSTCTE